MLDSRNISYFEFQKLPDYEPMVRVRLAKNQLLVEDREHLPAYISEVLKEECIHYKASKRRMMTPDDFTAQEPAPVRLTPSDIQFEYKGS